MSQSEWGDNVVRRAYAFISLTAVALIFQNCGYFNTARPDAHAASGARGSENARKEINGTSCKPKILSSVQSDLVRSFDIHMNDVGDGYSLFNNRAGILGNNEPSILEALLDVYQATADEKYLHRFIVHGDRVLSHRDDKAGHQNYQGRSHPTWSNGRYSTGGQFVSFLIEDGALIASLAQFAAIAKNTDCLRSVRDSKNRTFTAIAETYLLAAGETVAYHLKDWHTGLVNGHPIGYYRWPPDAPFTDEIPGKPVAVNYHSAMGTAMAHLYAATKNPSYLGYAQRLGNFILLEMSYNFNPSIESYSWPYHPQMPYWPGAGVIEYPFKDDLSHSTATAEFARAMHEQGLGVFYLTEMQRIARAYSRHVFQPSPHALAFNIDGTGPGAGAQHYQFARVAMLTPYEPALWSLSYDVAVTRLHTNQKGRLGSLGALTGLARLIRYYPK